MAKGTKRGQGRITIGIDLGAKTGRCGALEAAGEVLLERSVATTKKGMGQMFGALGRCRLALEVGRIRPG